MRQPVAKEFCQECAGVFPRGEHVWRDLDGVEHPACTGHNRAQAYLFGMRAFLDIGQPDPLMRRAKGYSVR